MVMEQQWMVEVLDGADVVQRIGPFDSNVAAAIYVRDGWGVDDPLTVADEARVAVLTEADRADLVAP